MQLSKEVIEILEYLCTKFGIVVDWTATNVMPYLEQLCAKFIAWEIATSWAWIGIMVVLLVISILIAFLVRDDFVIVIPIAFVIIGFQVFDIITCKTFPEKALIDYLSYISQTI